ncbi:MAG: penicillin acylase family protein, partial [Longimicrobiales bacterium]
MLRRVGIVVLVLASAGLAALGAAWLYARSSVPEPGTDLSLAGLHAEVRIGWDSLGVPHITASDEHDLLFAQGFVHARDRLWQMELLRRVMSGRLAEIFGVGYVESDAFLRTIGLMPGARGTEATLAPETRARLQAYVDGVNAAIEGWTGALPPEFVLLGIEPAPWTIAHVLGVEQVMSWDLAAYSTGLAVGRAIRRLGPERARWLLPEATSFDVPIVEPPALGPPPAPATALLDAFSVARASNAWVVAGSRTRSGRPILANDMHLALRAPPVWYLIALHAPGLDVAGMSLPGVPYVVAGHNRAIAWGFSNAGVDDVDLFIERLDPADPTRYLTPDGSAPFDVRVDTIRVKDAEPRELTIRSTRHGPVLPSSGAAGDDGVLALAWAAHAPSRTVEALPALNRAADWDAFLAAVRAFDNPHQNVVYADTGGRIGYAMGGRVPIRGDGRPAPLAPVPGWTGEFDW